MFPNDNNLILEVPKMKYATRLNYWRKGFWVDSILNVREVKGMSDQYLLSVYKLIKKQAEKHHQKTVNFYLSCPEPQGEQAQMMFEEEFDYFTSEEYDPETILYKHPFIPHLLREVLRRGTTPLYLRQFGIMTPKEEIEFLIKDLDKEIKALAQKAYDEYRCEYDELDPDPIDIGDLI